MKTKKIYKAIKTIFSVFMVFSAIGEITLHETVVHSMEIILMPAYLVRLLGVLKILGVLALWLSPYGWLKEWAYAGFTFDLLGAIYGFAATGRLILPDIIMAPLGLVLCITTYILWKKTNENRTDA